MSNHVWVTPPPGQGSRRNPVCKRCGVRSSVADKDADCAGTDRGVTIETQHDYDPMTGPSPDPDAERRAANAAIKSERRRAR